MSHREPSPVLTLTGANVYTAGPAVPYDDEGAVSEDRIALVSATPLTRPRGSSTRWWPPSTPRA